MLDRMRFLVLLLLIPMGAAAGAADVPPDTETLRLPFYSAEVILSFNPRAIDRRLAKNAPEEIKHFLWALDQGQMRALLHGLQTAKALHRLNDWLYLELCQKALAQTYPALSESEGQIALCWLLARSGYDARMVYDETGVDMVVRCREKVYNATSVYIDRGGPAYLLPSSLKNAARETNRNYYLDYAPNPRGKSLSFAFEGWPLLPCDTLNQHWTFTFDQREWRITLRMPTALRSLLLAYPVVESRMYWQTPMSPFVRRQLLEQLEPLVRELPPVEAIRLLLAFTRQAFPYRTDDAAFGFEKPFFAEELFLHPYSDCEDRVALFYNLVRNLLGFPMLVLELPDHLTTAVAFPGGEGAFIRQHGRIYWFCDPTSPLTSPGAPIPLAPDYETDAFVLLDSTL